MLISEKHKFIFIHIYKNAGTSITTALKSFAGSGQLQLAVNRLFKKIMLPSPFYDPQPYLPHIKASELIEIMGEDEFNSYFSFAFVRNPWDWQVSLYKFMLKEKSHHQHELIKEMGSFEEYIEWRCENDVQYQKDFIYSEEGKRLVDFVGRFENIDNDFNKICSQLGISSSLPKLNVSNTRPYQEYYTDSARDLVTRTFEPDIKLFEYEF